jgi:hypothetical protein
MSDNYEKWSEATDDEPCGCGATFGDLFYLNCCGLIMCDECLDAHNSKYPPIIDEELK